MPSKRYMTTTEDRVAAISRLYADDKPRNGGGLHGYDRRLT